MVCGVLVDGYGRVGRRKAKGCTEKQKTWQLNLITDDTGRLI